MLVGSKEIFGIQFEITQISKKSTLWGKIALWVDNKYIGQYNEETIIHSFNGTLLHKRHNDRNISSDFSLLEFIKSKDIEALQEREDSFYMTQIQTFDNFGLAIVYNTDKVVFCWELDKRRKEDHIGYPEGIQLGVVDKNIFNVVVDEYISNLPRGISP